MSGSLTETVTSGTLFNYTPTSTTPGTTYAWSRTAVIRISDVAANGTGNINETLINTARSFINVTYVYTLTANGCTNVQTLIAMAAGLLNITNTYSVINSINCNANRNTNVQKSPGHLSRQLSQQNLDVTVMPNHANTYFNFIIKSNNKGPVTVRVLDIFGQALEKHEKIIPGSSFRLGHTLKGGTYFAEVVQGDQRKIIKIIKIN